MKNGLRYSSGVIVGLLLSVFIGSSIFPEQKPQIQIQKQIKTVVKTVIVEKKVIVDREVKTSKVYRVSILNDDGYVIKEYEGIVEVKLRIIGATLTSESGRMFNVDGNIEVHEVK